MQTILLVQTSQTVNDFTWGLKVQFFSTACNFCCSKYILNHIYIDSFLKNVLSVLEQPSTNLFQKYEQNLSIAVFLHAFSYVVLDWLRIVVFHQGKVNLSTLICGKVAWNLDISRQKQCCFERMLWLHHQ